MAAPAPAQPEQPQPRGAAAVPPFHLALPTHDLAEARRFYGRVL